MGRNDDLVSKILSGIIIFIFLVIVYFCLDIFEIIIVPQKYSLTRFFGADISGALEGLAVEPIVDEKNIDTWINDKVSENIIVSEVQEIPEIDTNNNIQAEEIINSDKVTTAGKIYTNVANRMYYSQLDLYGRIIYDKMN